MKNKRTLIPNLFFLVLFLPCFSLNGQDTIYLKNSSFEDSPRKGQYGQSSKIQDWQDCALTKFRDQSPPDIHPVPGKAWGVDMKAFDGETYLGLVTRADFSWEYISQKLSTPLKAGLCYSFTAYLALSLTYASPTMKTTRLKTGEFESFVHPVSFRVWGGVSSCDQKEMLIGSETVSNTEWRAYEFVFSPHEDFSYITIEAFYDPKSLNAYNGHIMIDALSPMIEKDCNDHPKK